MCKAMMDTQAGLQSVQSYVIMWKLREIWSVLQVCMTIQNNHILKHTKTQICANVQNLYAEPKFLRTEITSQHEKIKKWNPLSVVPRKTYVIWKKCT